MRIREDVLRRLLVGKHFLATATGQLTPQSDAIAIAKMILTSHDATELALSAIADQINVPDLTDRLTLMDYPNRIEKHVPDQGPFPGGTFLRQLNTARRAFKHEGILPDVRTWHRVVENSWSWIDTYCKTYLGQALDEIDMDTLLDDAEVRDLYQQAKELQNRGHYQESFERLALSTYRVLRTFQGIKSPVLGQANINHALLLSAYGVRPSDFLSLQLYLPSVVEDRDSGHPKITWDTRKTGHRGNWTKANCRFCLETFLDMALKIQHASKHPEPVEFYILFDDVIRARDEGVELWRPRAEGDFPFTKVVGKDVVRRLKRGEEVRCMLWPVQKPTDELSRILGPRTTIETAETLQLWTETISDGIVFVEAKAVEVTYAPKERDYVREDFPHLFDKQ